MVSVRLRPWARASFSPKRYARWSWRRAWAPARAISAQGGNSEDSFDPALLSSGLDELAAEMQSIWLALPRQDGPQPWPTLCRLWALRRITARRFCRKSGQASDEVCEAYLAADPQLDTFARLEDA